jgi:hypothetical protein
MGDALEADLQRFYGVALPDMYRGEISARQISIYAKHLPRGSATGHLLGGPDAITEDREELWIIQNLLSGLAWQNAGSKGQPPKMRDYPKGWAEEQRKLRRTQSQAEAYARKRQQKQ